jgi:pyrroline-5-carboxylate reductase
MSDSILLIGAGNMGYAMMTGWLQRDSALRVHVVEPHDAFRDRAAQAGAQAVADIAQLPEGLRVDLVIVAVKPAMVAPVLARCGALEGAAFVSVAAGITLAQMAAALPSGTPLIRCMPNTPAAIGQGMMVLCPGAGVSAATRALAELLMASSGAIAWLEDESLMDAVTAISGSGPAYVFHFIEALTEAGRSLGLPDKLAALLAMQTVAGAGHMAQRSDEPPGVLRERVTSPGGTTAAALAVFMQDGALTRLVARATLAARDRGVELGAAG